MPKELIFAVISIPIVLLISLTVFQGIFSSSRTTFETQIINETLGTGAGTYYSAYPAKVGSAIIYNGTTVCPTNVCVIDYMDGLAPMKVTVGSGAGSTQIKASYVAYSKEGYSSYVSTYRGTTSGYSLSSMLPFVLIALVVVGALVGALAMRR